MLSCEIHGVWGERTIFLASDASALMAELESPVVNDAEALWEHHAEWIQVGLSYVKDLNEAYGAKLDPNDWGVNDLIELLKLLIQQKRSELIDVDGWNLDILGNWHDLINGINELMPDGESWLRISMEGSVSELFRYLAEREAIRASKELLHKVSAFRLTDQPESDLIEAGNAAILAGFTAFSRLPLANWRAVPCAVVRAPNGGALEPDLGRPAAG